MPRKCPDCAEGTVTLTPDEGTILGHPIEDFVLSSDNGDQLRVTAFCWECGWEEEKTLSIEVNT